MNTLDQQDDAFRNLLIIIISRKWILLTGFFSLFIMSVVGSFMLPDVYDAHTKVYVSLPTVPNYINLPYLNDFQQQGSFISNQYEILKSRFIREKVVKELNLDKKTLKLSFTAKMKKFLKNLLDIDNEVNLFVAAVDNLQENTSIDFTKGSNILEITAYAKSADAAAAIANTYAETYIAYANDILYSKAQNAYDYIKQQVEEAQKKLEKSESILNDFRRSANAISFQGESSLILKQLGELDNQYQQIQNEIYFLKKQLSQNERKSIRGGTDLLTIGNHYQKLQEKLRRLNVELETSLIDYKQEHPQIRYLKNKIAKLENQISLSKDYNLGGDTIKNNDDNPAIEIQINNLRDRSKKIKMRIEQLNSKLDDLSHKESVLANLASNFESNKKTYENLHEKLENARILTANEMQSGTIKIIEYATPPQYPAKKKRIVLILLGTMTGMLFGLGMAFIAEYLDDSLNNVEDVQKALDVPVLGHISYITKKMQYTSVVSQRYQKKS